MPSLPTTRAGRRVLAGIRAIRPFLEGSLTITGKRCGRPTCRCARQGPLHEVALLTWKEGARTRTLHVPQGLRKEVAAWVAEARRLHHLRRKMSAAQRAFLRARRTRARRAR